MRLLAIAAARERFDRRRLAEIGRSDTDDVGAARQSHKRLRYNAPMQWSLLARRSALASYAVVLTGCCDCPAPLLNQQEQAQPSVSAPPPAPPVPPATTTNDSLTDQTGGSLTAEPITTGEPPAVAPSMTAPPAEPPPAEPEEPLGPTPATETANFPFPQNRFNERCVPPSQIRNSDVVAAFEHWKAETVTSEGANGFRRVKRLPSDPNLELGSTVSEGVAYGMLIAVYMDDQPLFDDLWQYSQQWLDEKGLMHWYINAAGTDVLDIGAASDADEDMAWALLMADYQWGASEALDRPYEELAKELIERIWQHEIHEGKLLKPGDRWGDWSTVNISYLAPSYYRAFAEATDNPGWLDVVVTSYDAMENSLNEANGNVDNGLVPAWSTSDGEPNGGVWGERPAPTHYQYDSCRTPFRIGLDYCFHAEPRARDYVAKTSSFFSEIGVASMTDGYELDGTPRPEFDGHSAAFIGPAAVGAMHDGLYQSFVDEAYAELIGLDLLVGGAYYDLSWTVLALLMLTGNFLDYSQEAVALPPEQ